MRLSNFLFFFTFVLAELKTSLLLLLISEFNFERDLIEYFLKRLDLSHNEYDKVMNEIPKSWTEYPTYKKRFEFFRPLFAMLAKANLVPMSFYLKYCFPSKV